MHEPFVGQLMIALYRSGRHADALEVYERARLAFLELGLHPSRDLQELSGAIVRQDDELRLPTRTDVLRRPSPRRRVAVVAVTVVAAAAVAAALAATRSTDAPPSAIADLGPRVALLLPREPVPGREDPFLSPFVDGLRQATQRYGLQHPDDRRARVREGPRGGRAAGGAGAGGELRPRAARGLEDRRQRARERGSALAGHTLRLPRRRPAPDAIRRLEERDGRRVRGRTGRLPRRLPEWAHRGPPLTPQRAARDLGRRRNGGRTFGRGARGRVRARRAQGAPVGHGFEGLLRRRSSDRTPATESRTGRSTPAPRSSLPPPEPAVSALSQPRATVAFPGSVSTRTTPTWGRTSSPPRSSASTGP